MAVFQEVLVAASSAESPLLAWDIQTGKLLASYKQSASYRNSLCPVGREYFAASQSLKTGGAVFFWQWQKTAAVFKSYPNELVGPLACSSDGAFIAGGGHSGLVFFWEVATGKLLRSWQAHLSAVACLIFSDDDSLLISGGEDGMINVWPIARTLDTANDQSGDREAQSVQSMYSFHDHTQSITGLFAGTGGGAAVVASSSADHTCKFYSLGMGQLLRSVTFPVSINAPILDPGEYCFYGGGSDGRIFMTPLIIARSETSDGVEEEREDTLLEGHNRAITALAFSMGGVLLVSASEDCTACVWCTASKKVLRRFEHPRGPIMSILLVPRPPQMPAGQGHDPPSRLNKRGPSMPIAQLRRYPVGSEFGETTSGNPWEGPPVILPAYLGSKTGPEEAEDWSGPSFTRAAMERHMEDMQEEGSVANLQISLERKRTELNRALNIADKYKQNFDLSYKIASDLLAHAREKDHNMDKVPVKGGPSGPSKSKDKGKGKSKNVG